MNRKEITNIVQEAKYEESGGRKAQKIFYGWWIVGGCFLILVVSVGAGLYSLPIFLVPLQEHFGWTRTSISIGAAIASISIGLMAPCVGAIISRFGMRPTMFVGTLIMAFGFIGYASITLLWHFWVASVVVAIGLSMVAFVPVQTLISLWFSRRRGLAMGLTLAGVGFGGLVLAPITGLLIADQGWRIAYATLAGVVLVPVLLVLLFVLRDTPSIMGLQPDGDPAPKNLKEEGHPDPSVLTGLEFAEALHTKAFWVLIITVFFASFTSFGIVQHLPALLTDAGYTPAVAANTLGTAIGLSVIGRVLGGTMSDRFGAQWIYAFLVGSITVSAVVLLWPDQKFALIAFSVCFGLGLGGINVLLPLLVGMCFGLKDFSKTVGVVILAATLGSSTGPLFVGMLYDINGDYKLALAALIALGMMGIITATFIRRPRSFEIVTER